jgi:hypothetical protein
MTTAAKSKNVFSLIKRLLVFVAIQAMMKNRKK